MNRVTLYRNFDERQAIAFSAPSMSSLRYQLEVWCKKHKDECDGLTLGEPDVDAKHFILSRNEDTPPEMEWELQDNVSYEDSDVGTFEVMYLNFINVVINYVSAGMKW